MNHLLTTLEIALRSSIDHLENLDKQPVAPTADYTQLRRVVDLPAPKITASPGAGRAGRSRRPT